MNKTFITLVVALFIGINAYAQTLGNTQSPTAVKIMDFTLLPLMQANATSGDSVELLVKFKINQPADAASVHLWLGTAPESSDIMVATAVNLCHSIN